MCQFLHCCNCCWTNQCGVSAGCGYALCCFSLWCCAPPELEHFRGRQIARCGCVEGYGMHCFCCGDMCLIPQWLRDYSILATIGERRGEMYNLQIIEKRSQVQINNYIVSPNMQSPNQTINNELMSQNYNGQTPRMY